MSKHLQLLWCNLGDFFNLAVEGKYIQNGLEVFGEIKSFHSSSKQFFLSLYYRIFKELLEQDDPINFFRTNSTVFLTQCIIDIMIRAAGRFRHNLIITGERSDRRDHHQMFDLDHILGRANNGRP